MPAAVASGNAGDTERSAAPSEPPAEPPTLGSLAAQIAELQRGLRVVIRHSTPPPEPPRSSIRVAATSTTRATKIGMAVLGAAAVAGEFVASNYPHAIGPLRALCRIALRLLDAGASP